MPSISSIRARWRDLGGRAADGGVRWGGQLHVGPVGVVHDSGDVGVEVHPRWAGASTNGTSGTFVEEQYGASDSATERTAYSCSSRSLEERASWRGERGRRPRRHPYAGIVPARTREVTRAALAPDEHLRRRAEQPVDVGRSSTSRSPAARRPSGHRDVDVGRIRRRPRGHGPAPPSPASCRSDPGRPRRRSPRRRRLFVGRRRRSDRGWAGSAGGSGRASTASSSLAAMAVDGRERQQQLQPAPPPGHDLGHACRAGSPSAKPKLAEAGSRPVPGTCTPSRGTTGGGSQTDCPPVRGGRPNRSNPEGAALGSHSPGDHALATPQPGHRLLGRQQVHQRSGCDHLDGARRDESACCARRRWREGWVTTG